MYTYVLYMCVCVYIWTHTLIHILTSACKVTRQILISYTEIETQMISSDLLYLSQSVNQE